jgi:hypothetical protein
MGHRAADQASSTLPKPAHSARHDRGSRADAAGLMKPDFVDFLQFAPPRCTSHRNRPLSGVGTLIL